MFLISVISNVSRSGYFHFYNGNGNYTFTDATFSLQYIYIIFLNTWIGKWSFTRKLKDTFLLLYYCISIQLCWNYYQYFVILLVGVWSANLKSSRNVSMDTNDVIKKKNEHFPWINLNIVCAIRVNDKHFCIFYSLVLWLDPHIKNIIRKIVMHVRMQSCLRQILHSMTYCALKYLWNGTWIKIMRST